VSLITAPASADGTDPAPTVDQVVATTDTTAVTPPAELSTEQATATTTARRSRVAIGDSITVGAMQILRRDGFSIHAKVGRQFSTAPGIVASYGGSLPRNVVIALGTNGTVSLSACRSVVRTAGPARRVFLVTNRVPRAWQDSNNATLRACDRSFSARRVRVVDWYRASAGHPQWFASDGIHPSAAGRRAFARLIDRTVDRYGR
jgi:hypothetical protein